MKNGKADIERAKRIQAAVDAVCKTRHEFTSLGARIEEVLGEPLATYPDEILSMDLLPSIDGFQFIGWDADFNPVECRQDKVGEKWMVSANVPLVGWKPKRIKPKPLEGRIG